MTSERCLKIMVIGDSTVGKTSIMTRFCDDTFSPVYASTFGLDFKSKKIEINGKQIKLQVWDTAGQERFNTIVSSYYRGASGIFLVYDVTNVKSFQRVAFWMENIKKYARSDTEVAIMANKTDLKDERKVTSMDGEQLAKSFGVPYYETSAKSNINIEEAFFKLARAVISEVKNEPNHNTVQLSKAKTKKCPC